MITVTRRPDVYLDLLRLDALRWTVPAANRPEAVRPEPGSGHEDGPRSLPAWYPATYQRVGVPSYPGASWGRL